MTLRIPAGFVSHTGNIGIKDETADFAVLAATGPIAATGPTAAGVFTQMSEKFAVLIKATADTTAQLGKSATTLQAVGTTLDRASATLGANCDELKELPAKFQEPLGALALAAKSLGRLAELAGIAEKQLSDTANAVQGADE